jgi:hypothetical protein
MEEKELWMNKLKEKLADYSEPAPASGWEQLEKELMPPVEKKIYPYRKWMMAAAAVREGLELEFESQTWRAVPGAKTETLRDTRNGTDRHR